MHCIKIFYTHFILDFTVYNGYILYSNLEVSHLLQFLYTRFYIYVLF